MLNQVVLVGRLVNDHTSDFNKLAVPRSFKNDDGVYETDFIDFKTSGSTTEKTKEFCVKGDLVGIKGKLYVNDNGYIVDVEKITFLSNR